MPKFKGKPIRKEKKEANFFMNPHLYWCRLIKEKVRGILEVSRKEVEEYIHSQYTNPSKNTPTRPTSLYTQTHTDPSALNSVRSGRWTWKQDHRQPQDRISHPNRILCKLDMNCPRVFLLYFSLVPKEHIYVSKKWYYLILSLYLFSSCSVCSVCLVAT